MYFQLAMKAALRTDGTTIPLDRFDVKDIIVPAGWRTGIAVPSIRKKMGRGGRGVESRVDRINLSRLSILEPTKLNCSLSASIVGHPTFNDEFSSLRERVGRKLFVSRETKVFEEEYYFSL